MFCPYWLQKHHTNTSSYFFGHICITYYRTEAEIFLPLSPGTVGYTDSLLVKSIKFDSCGDGGVEGIFRWAGNYEVFLFFLLKTETEEYP